MKQELVRNISKWGNSSGILLPREWAGMQARVIIIDRTMEIKKEVLNILDSYLDDIQGIYLIGSYARGDQDENSDIDILAISGKTKKLIESGKYSIQIATLDSIKKSLEKDAMLILPRLIEAKPLINSSLLEQLKSTRIPPSAYKELIASTKRIININKEFLNLEDTEILDAITIIYSLVLRLRGLYMLKCIKNGQQYSKKEFERWVIKESELTKEEFNDIYQVYRELKDGKKPSIKIKIKVESSRKIFNLLKKEVDKHDK